MKPLFIDNSLPSKVLGIMSGTSLDGIDFCISSFHFKKNNAWEYSIIHCETIEYSKEWKLKLQNAHKLNGLGLCILNNEYGTLIGNLANKIIEKHPVNLICSHGHTIFHQPEKQMTFQLGDGATIAATTGINTINQFRNTDIALKGQGAPLVPIGDVYLFNNYKYRVNLGGFANFSMGTKQNLIGGDICPCNIILNYFANQKGLQYDIDSSLGNKGTIQKDIQEKLNNLEFYQQPFPKSLGREWLEQQCLPLIDQNLYSIENIMATLYDHIGQQIGKILSETGEALLTGGGAYNKLLIKSIKKYSKAKIIVPPSEVIDFKEALIFALLGMLFINKEINTLNTYTGATKSSIGGAFYFGNKQIY